MITPIRMEASLPEKVPRETWPVVPSHGGQVSSREGVAEDPALANPRCRGDGMPRPQITKGQRGVEARGPAARSRSEAGHLQVHGLALFLVSGCSTWNKSVVEESEMPLG